jgi:hypothetical protein
MGEPGLEPAASKFHIDPGKGGISMTHAHSVWICSFLAVAGLALDSGVMRAADQKEQAGPGRAATVTGRIVSVRPAEGQITLQTMEGKELELNLDQGSQLRLHRQPATLSQFNEGIRVRVPYEPAGGRNRVLSLWGAPVTANEVQQELHNAISGSRKATRPTSLDRGWSQEACNRRSRTAGSSR